LDVIKLFTLQKSPKIFGLLAFSFLKATRPNKVQKNIPFSPLTMTPMTSLKKTMKKRIMKKKCYPEVEKKT